MKSLFALAASILTDRAQAWWNNGHMITAKIAYDYLMEHNPEVVAKVEEVLKPTSYLTTHEANHIFVEAATFADDLKLKGFNDQSPWHFIDQPFFDGIANHTVFPENFNVTWSIDYMTKNL